MRSIFKLGDDTPLLVVDGEWNQIAGDHDPLEELLERLKRRTFQWRTGGRDEDGTHVTVEEERPLTDSYQEMVEALHAEGYAVVSDLS